MYTGKKNTENKVILNNKQENKKVLGLPPKERLF